VCNVLRKIAFYGYFYVWDMGARRTSVRLIGEIARPYLLWKIAKLLRVRFAQSAELAVQHVDATVVEPCVGLNGRCVDISKSFVADAFARVFGYDLAVDPATHVGPMVEKGEGNAAHDGRVVEGPIIRQPGRVYQKLIDTTDNGDVVDLRVGVIGEEIPYVYIKRRPELIRFSNTTHSVVVRDVDAVFDSSEQLNLTRFAWEVGLDFGELDVLRDKASGRIYVVDVAKTPHSPGDACINLRGIRAMHRAAEAFRRQFLRPTSRQVLNKAVSL
jgi:hypothetical protein